MVPHTRRTFLHGAVGLSTLLAGCSGLFGESVESTDTPARDGDGTEPASGSVTDPETLALRVATDRPPIWLAESGDATDGRPTATGRDHVREHIVVDEPARADRISVSDAVDRESVASFLGATDFDTETVYVELAEIEACFRLDLCHVGWTATRISTDYTRRTRPYTDRCEADELVFEARLVRIPDAIDAEEVHSYSSSIGTGACDRHGATAEGAAGSAAAGRRGQTPTETTTDTGGDQ